MPDNIQDNPFELEMNEENARKLLKPKDGGQAPKRIPGAEYTLPDDLFGEEDLPNAGKGENRSS